MKRIAIGGIVHETNTFVPAPTPHSEFVRQSYQKGEALVAAFRGTQTALGGVIAGLEQIGYQVAPLLYTAAMPSGLVAREAYETLRDELIEKLKAAQPLDGVLLVLHGAMVADGYLDCEGDMLERARAVIGKACPLVSTLDMHGNLSEAMVAAADALVAFDENPHLDTFARGLEAADIMRRMVDEGLRTAKALVRPSLLLTALTTWTERPPLSAVHERGHAMEQDPRVVNVSVMGGFAYADTPFTGMSILVQTAGDAALAQACADELRAIAWDNRAPARHYGVSIEEAVRRAVEMRPSSARGPIVLADVGDNVGGGSPGDSTFLLRALLEVGAQDAVVTIADVDAVATAIRIGEGGILEMPIGGKVDYWHGKPVAARGLIERLTNGRFNIEGTDHFAQLYGNSVNMGRCAIVRYDGVRVLLTERKTPPGDLAQLRSQGIIPEEQNIIVAKSAVAFRGAYQRIAREIIEVDTPGLVAANLSRFTYKHLPRPIFPLDMAG